MPAGRSERSIDEVVASDVGMERRRVPCWEKTDMRLIPAGVSDED